ncbi:MAG TPA: acyltransferase family protein [Tepidisphaeraceae bacterium]|nr:acyltransferase family protein [Tepidisphaeraceae bacterium]
MKAATLPTATQDGGPPAPRRLLYIDNLRIMLTALVVIHHAAVPYSDIPMWYYIEPVHDRSAIALDILLIFNQTFFMGFFFLISGYFVPTSYDRKGPGKFLRERLIRLGIPLVIFIIVLSPILSAGFYPMAKADEAAKGIDLPYWRFYLTTWSPGPMWFVEVLLVFCALYAMVRGLRAGHPDERPSEATPTTLPRAILAILGYALALAALTYLWRIFVPAGQYWPIVGLPTPTYLPQYTTLFVIGLIACRRGWAHALPVSAGWFGLALLLCMIASAVIMSLTTGPRSVAMAWTALESLGAVGIIVALFVLFRQRFNRQGRLARTLSEHAYTVYFRFFRLLRR